MRIGFLFNHDQVHQVAHALPIAAAFRLSHPSVEVVVAVSNARLQAEVARLSALLGVSLPVLRLERGGRARRLIDLLDAVLPAKRLSLYGDNLDFFRSLDALVVPEKTSLVLKRRHGLSLPIIHSRHGAGDRAIGFNAESAEFDHILVSGRKIAERLIGQAGVAPERISVVGYAKFDLAVPRAALPFADPTRPVVLYNPHNSPHLSSWFRDGRAVLDYFRRSDRYNLIFAPHVMLFERRFAASLDRLRLARVGRVPRSVLRAPNIHVDLGSPASTDMRYTDAADLYLGDVSSQLYEYLRRPRPCLFLDSHHVRPEGDPSYAGWAAGPVINGPAELDAGLRRALEMHPAYLKAQRALFTESFDLTDEPSSERAARAILRALGSSAGV